MVTLILGDALEALKTLPSESVDMCLTSPPYWKLKDYKVPGQMGREPTLAEYLANLFAVFEEVKRVLKPHGTLWLNMGDTYAGDGDGLPKKCLFLVPARLAIMLTDTGGWILRNRNVWHKPNPVPGSVTDRFTVDYEDVLFFSKSKDYFFNQQKEPAVSTDLGGRQKSQNLAKWKPNGFRNKRTVWNKVKPGPYGFGHPAPFPEALAEIPILAGSNPGGVILDPFVGAGTTAIVSERLERHCVGIDLSLPYLQAALERLRADREKRGLAAPASPEPAR